MKIETTPLEGLLIIHPRIFNDERGFFFESYNEERFREYGLNLAWAQDNHAKSVMNTVRGLHLQSGRGQDKLVRCVRGAIWDVAVDVRPDSATFGKWFAHELTEENKDQLYIPTGFAHGYAVLTDNTEVIYKCSSVYNAKLETGFRWNDPQVGVSWPIKYPILSQRDQTSQSFQEFTESLKIVDAARG